MLPYYFSALTLAATAWGFYGAVPRSPVYRPLRPLLFDLCGGVAALFTIGLFIGGFFAGEWWLPLSAIAGATIIGAVIRATMRSAASLPGWTIGVTGLALLSGAAAIGSAV